MSSPHTPDLLPPAVRDGPATAKLVYLALDEHAPATVDTLTLATGQSRRSVVTALAELEGLGFVTRRPDETDPRRELWTVAE